MSMPHRRPRLLPSVAALAALLLALPAAAQILGIDAVTTSPEVPTWQDRVEVTIAGTSRCPVFVDEIRNVNVDTLAVDILPNCPLAPPGPPAPFVLRTTLPRLRPDVYELRVVSEGDTLARTGLIVRQPAPLVLDLPEGPVTDDEIFTFRLGFLASCPSVEVVSVEAGVATLVVRDECPILPPAPSQFNTVLNLGRLAPGPWEIRAFAGGTEPEAPVARASFRVFDDDGCVPGDEVLCLNGARFRVRVAWTDFQGGTGNGRAVPLADLDETGAFWFFHPDNLELTVKVLDGCGVNGHYWVFVAPGSTAGWSLVVEDTEKSGEPLRAYGNAAGSTPGLVADTAAFACS